jgi:hypothetical protein
MDEEEKSSSKFVVNRLMISRLCHGAWAHDISGL